MTKNNGLIDSGIHENQGSSEDENDKLEPAEVIRPTQQLSYVPLSKYVRPTQTQKSSSGGAEINSTAHYTQSYLVDNNGGQKETVFIGKDGVHRVGTSR